MIDHLGVDSLYIYIYIENKQVKQGDVRKKAKCKLVMAEMLLSMKVCHSKARKKKAKKVREKHSGKKKGIRTKS